MRARLPAATTVLVLLLAACSSGDDGADASALEGATWVLDAASMGSLTDTVPAEARVDLTFEAREARGTSACNSYSGSYTVDGDQLTFGPLASTQMACDEALMDLEAAYLAALGDVSGFEVSDEGLVLSDGDVSLSYEAEAPAEALPLVGTAWTLTSIATGDAVSSTIAGIEVMATFGEDGTVAGNDGCNQYHGPYSVSDGSIEIGELAGTLMACEPDVDRQAQDFREGMAAATAYEIDGTSLTLLDGAGSLLLAFDGAA
jgi:heat shock protein HslJ